MASLPPSSKYVQRASEPVTAEEREALNARLTEAFADGRISQDHYREMLDRLFGATKLGDLAPLVAELPAAPAAVPDIVRTGGALPAGQTNEGRSVVRPAMLAVGAGVGLLTVLLLVLAVLL